MATNGMKGMTPVLRTLTTPTNPLEVIHTVPDGVEQTFLEMRACNKTSTDGFVTIGIRNKGQTAGAEKFVAYNCPVRAGAPQNIFGPDALGPLPAGTMIVARGSAPDAFDLVITGTERTITP